MSNQNEEIKLSNEYLNNKKQVLKLKESKTKKMYSDDKKKSKLELPKDDTFVEMGIYAKNLTMPKKVRERLLDEYDVRGEKAPATIKLDLIKDKIPEVNINGTNYIIREVINETDGFQAIVFENPNTHECTFTIAGSYSLKQPHLNFAEWDKDWRQNNLAIGFKHLPPQLETAIKNLDRCKEKYNITSVTGYSLGAILAGLLVQFKRNKHLKTYLYNGGLPKKLVNALQERYGDEISLDEPLNMVTMLSNGELVTDLLSIVRGAGIFLLKGGKAGHELENLKNSTNKSYKEIDQSGIAIIDGLKDELSNSTIGTGGMYRLSIPLDLSKTVKEEKEEQTENNNTNSPDEQNGNKPLEGRVEENVYKDSADKSDGIPVGYVTDLTTDDTERELLKQLRENSRADIGIADKIRNEGKILEKLINHQAQNDSQSTKPSTQEELEKDELYQRIKKERGQVKVINSNEFSWEQIIKDTLAFPNAMRDFCYPSEKSPFGKSSEIFTNISDIKKNEYYTPPQPKENRKSTHGRYLNPAHEEEIERVVSSIFDSVAREMGY